jgi:DNA-binding GntR family transcriptional regulator
LRDNAELCRRFSSLHAADAKRDIVGEHRELMELATGRRAGEAAAALERHLRRITEIVLEPSTADELA